MAIEDALRPTCPKHGLPMHQDLARIDTPLTCARCAHESYLYSLSDNGRAFDQQRQSGEATTFHVAQWTNCTNRTN